MAVVQNELRANLRLTGETAMKAGLKGVGNAAEDAGDDLRQMGKDADFLQRKLTELKATQVALVKQLNTTGDVSLIKDLNKARREVRQYERLSAELAAVNAAEAGVTAGSAFMSGFAEITRGGLQPIAIGALIAAAAALVPGLSAMVAGAVTGIVGAGGIVGGIVAAAHDPAVKHAAEDLSMTLKSSFSEIGSPFVGPVVASLELVKDAGRQIAGDLKHDFDILAPALVPFTKGLLGLVTEMMPGLTEAFKSSLPVLQAMSAEFPKIGHAIGEFFRLISEDEDAAVIGFISLSKVIQNVLIGAGKFIQVMGTLYKNMVAGGAVVTSLLQQTTSWLAIAGGPAGQYWVKQLNETHDLYQGLLDDTNKAIDASGEFTQGLYGMGSAAQRAAADIGEIEQAINDLFDVTMSMEQAQVAWAKGLRSLTEELREGKKTLQLNTEEGIKNREALDDQIRIAEQFRDAQLAMGIPLDQANKKYLEQIESLRQLALKMGFARGEVDQFIKKWLEIPNAKTIQLNIVAGGDAAAWAAFRNLERQQAAGAPKPLPPGVAEFRAGGGPVMAGRSYVVGEHGPEFFNPATNGYVSNASQTAAMMSGASGGMYSPTFVFSDSGRPSGDAGKDALVTWLWPDFVKRVRINGGDPSALGAA